MRQRAVSSVGVVIVGLVPALIGGPVFALVFLVIAAIGAAELFRLLGLGDVTFKTAAYAVLASCALVPLLWRGDGRLQLAIALALVIPLTVAVVAGGSDPIRAWTQITSSILYLGVPVLAAVDLRETAGTAAGWLESIASSMPVGRDGTAKGLGWLLLAIIVTWMTDTGAFVVGRSLGRHKLMPRISPNKTVEGAVGGLVAAAVTAALGAAAFGLGVEPVPAAMLGICLGATGMLGDLGESTLKRQAGVKDSGALIPGHGGVLDRIDALLFVLVVTWVAVPLLA